MRSSFHGEASLTLPLGQLYGYYSRPELFYCTIIEEKEAAKATRNNSVRLWKQGLESNWEDAQPPTSLFPR